ncbi:MAG: lipocalin-like domain-containing protein [Thermoanaerobaculaceae bacterium]|nr:lipocalin-like domain-containing protein [Thermoanaerobaculaceae bacterium]TAM52996.1 MAG: carotenoid 1,2-hydratase [Acidobacteriota bacterium]
MGRTLALLLAAPALAAAVWQTVNTPPALQFPRDHGAHPAFQTEWWYVTGELADASGRHYGFQLTFFRQGLEPGPSRPGGSALRARQVLAANLAVADIAAGRTRFAERVRRIGSGLAAAAEGDLDVVLDDWGMRRSPDGTVTLAAADRDAAIGLHLELAGSRRLVLEGDAGLSRKGPGAGNASVYVSDPRMAARGTIEIGGDSVKVNGEAWFDHEWGTSQLGPGVVGWDWLGLRLADGRALMLYRLRRADGRAAPESAGTLVARDGSTRRLAAGDFTFAPLTWWASPRTGARYPARVRVTVPAAGLDVEVRPEVADAELDARRSTGTIYWEGPVAVTGSVTGDGYAEFTGYASSLAGRF